MGRDATSAKTAKALRFKRKPQAGALQGRGRARPRLGRTSPSLAARPWLMLHHAGGLLKPKARGKLCANASGVFTCVAQRCLKLRREVEALVRGDGLTRHFGVVVEPRPQLLQNRLEVGDQLGVRDLWNSLLVHRIPEFKWAPGWIPPPVPFCPRHLALVDAGNRCFLRIAISAFGSPVSRRASPRPPREPGRGRIRVLRTPPGGRGTAQSPTASADGADSRGAPPARRQSLVRLRGRLKHTPTNPAPERPNWSALTQPVASVTICFRLPKGGGCLDELSLR
jgi:hypothetical protein